MRYYVAAPPRAPSLTLGNNDLLSSLYAGQQREVLWWEHRAL
jgi:hypothetical protein